MEMRRLTLRSVQGMNWQRVGHANWAERLEETLKYGRTLDDLPERRRMHGSIRRPGHLTPVAALDTFS
jgi:hypothetical protein